MSYTATECSLLMARVQPSSQFSQSTRMRTDSIGRSLIQNKCHFRQRQSFVIEEAQQQSLFGREEIDGIGKVTCGNSINERSIADGARLFEF